MGFYKTNILPGLTNLVCSQKDVSRQRRKVVPHARGRVLEIGMGSGLNLPFYNPNRIDLVWGLEPSDALRRMAVKKAERMPFHIEFIGHPSEDIPLESRCADTVVVTYTLCSIPGISKALAEMRRVLKPGGELLFLEHGRSPDKGTARMQDLLNPLWKPVSGSCHLNRRIDRLIESNGFKLTHLETGYMSPIKLISFNYWGAAVSK
ncbi:class I SAM-dependent methyltransferase [uncultured Desulfobacter sp.]|uniref:class I SAM-dependent methyltransferase n=1 Tax=uncultured Desulfobacter sp. TaxID=240139 RepID=UPI002AABC8F8|nr:class I SAM-dependent methyltransferase [uncultured Desulfobacter sp.]